LGPELRSGASPIRSGGLPHIKQLVRVVTSRAYRGIDIDYENLALTTDLVLAKKVQRMPGVYDYTAKKAPLGKVELGVPTYGRDWSSGTAATLTGQQAINLARAHGVTPVFDRVQKELTFRYRAKGVGHRVWFSNPRAVAARYQLARNRGMVGAAYWAAGLEQQGTWRAVRNRKPRRPLLRR
jgi:spore germination protein YaaH